MAPNRPARGISKTLSKTLDGKLQKLVEQAARELGFPIALVSLVLDHIQFFRAHYGLPPELAATQATDRQVSFCQFVVKDGAPFLVEDALENPRVPKELVDAYQIRAYAGFPVRLNQSVVGSLCVIDTRPRTTTPEQKRKMMELAQLVSQRLQEIHDQEARLERLGQSDGTSALESLRSIASHLEIQEETQRVLLAELEPLGEVLRMTEASAVTNPAARKAHSVLRQSWLAHQQLLESMEALAKLRAELGAVIGALEGRV